MLLLSAFHNPTAMNNSHTNSDFYGKNDKKTVSEWERNHIEDIPGTQRCSHNSQISEGNAKTHANAEEKVAGKVEEDAIPDSRLTYTSDGGYSTHESNLINTRNPEDLVRDWEASHLYGFRNNKLSPGAREIALCAATLHIVKGKGITVKDLQKMNRLHIDNAEKKLQDAKNMGLLIPSEIRIGKQKQYVLSNYKHILDSKAEKKKNKDTEINPDYDITLLLVRALSHGKYVYHHINLETNLCYGEDYNAINWPISSDKNKQKVQTFKLDSKRNCTFTLSPTGTISISIECTHHPFELHTPEGIVDFFGSCGQAFGILQEAANNRLGVVNPIFEWCLMQFDYNKDISAKDMDQIVVGWSALGQLRLRHIGSVFQIYPKHMPEMGERHRVEGQYSTKEKDNVVDVVKDIGGEGGNMAPFTTAEDMLSKTRDNINRSNVG